MSIESAFQQAVPEMPLEDIEFLLKQLGDSESSKSSARNLLIKLKMEFSEQLSQHKKKVEAERLRAIQREVAQAKIKNELMRKHTFSDSAERRRKVQELQKYLDKHWHSRHTNGY